MCEDLVLLLFFFNYMCFRLQFSSLSFFSLYSTLLYYFSKMKYLCQKNTIFKTTTNQNFSSSVQLSFWFISSMKNTKKEPPPSSTEKNIFKEYISCFLLFFFSSSSIIIIIFSLTIQKCVFFLLILKIIEI